MNIASPPTPRSTKIFWTITALFFVLYLVRSWTAGDNDFIAYYNAGVRAAAGESPYRLEGTPYRYLPLTAFFFSPLTLLPFKFARSLFFVLNYAAVVAIYFEIRKRTGDLATFLIALLFFRFHNHDFGNAQINPLLLCLFFAWWNYRRRSLPLPTLAFALFASFKIIPFAFGLPLLFLRRGKELIWIGLWTVTLNFLPIFFYERGPLIFVDWYNQAKTIGYPAVMLTNVQSLQSALWWWLDGKMDVSLFGILSPLLQLTLLVAVVFASPKSAPGAAPEIRRENWMIASTLGLTVLISQLAWKHNYLQFLPLVFLWFREDPGFRARETRTLYGIFLGGMVLIPSLLSAWDRTFSDHTYLMVWAGLAVLFVGLRYSRSKSGAGNYLPHVAARD